MHRARLRVRTSKSVDVTWIQGTKFCRITKRYSFNNSIHLHETARMYFIAYSSWSIVVESIVGERTFGNKYLLDWLSMGCSIIITSLRIAAVNSCEDSSPDLSVSSTCPQIHEVKFIHCRQSCSLRRIRLATLKSLWRRMERSWSSVKSSDSFFRRGSSGFLHGNVTSLESLTSLARQHYATVTMTWN